MRVTRLKTGPRSVTLKVEGRVTAECADLVQSECEAARREYDFVVLDLRHVAQVDADAAHAIRSLVDRDLASGIDATPLLAELLLDFARGRGS